MAAEIPGFDRLIQQYTTLEVRHERLRRHLASARKASTEVWAEMQSARHLALEDILKDNRLGICDGYHPYNAERIDLENLGVFSVSDLSLYHSQEIEEEPAKETLYYCCETHSQFEEDMLDLGKVFCRPVWEECKIL